ncbi:hypothetical protein ACCD10_17645 [Pseudomonas sp. Pseusp122]|jgi:hypothetical protein|uniref:hypothetical protein n=1 Tax=unclassified Pseudomonas TaxID=196821 RepID=UPI0021686504|nr:hypothetical protein [Pseudomonas sp. JUb42]MCS3467067.1 hypothetical protein [Pseudomonas sp. JUb42]
MSLPELPKGNSRRELRKALIRLRMEMHRQELRHESSQLLNPLRRARHMAHDLPGSLGIKHAPLWGVAAVTLLGFLSGKRAKGPGNGNFSRFVKLSASLIPLLKLALQSNSRKP